MSSVNERCAVAAGCAELAGAEGMWVERYGNRMLIVCNGSLMTSYLTCVDNQWKGVKNNCSQGEQNLYF